MIYGIGTDIVEIKRIASMKSLDTFAKKILSKNEIKTFDALKSSKKMCLLF